MEIPAIDGAALIAEVRRGKPDAIDHAYRLTFATDLGRLVLAHHLMECGVGNTLGVDNLKYSAGRHDAGLMLAARAGFDQATLAVAVLTDQMEGNSDEDPAFNYSDHVADDGDLFD